MSIVPFPRDAAHTAGGTALSGAAERSGTPGAAPARPGRAGGNRLGAGQPRPGPGGAGSPGSRSPQEAGRSAACPGTNRAAASACQAGGGTDFGRLQALHVSRPSSPHAARPRQRRQGPLSSAGGPAALPEARRRASPRPGHAADGGGERRFRAPSGQRRGESVAGGLSRSSSPHPRAGRVATPRRRIVPVP